MTRYEQLMKIDALIMALTPLIERGEEIARRAAKEARKVLIEARGELVVAPAPAT
jgi:hypothetical protein